MPGRVSVSSSSSKGDVACPDLQGKPFYKDGANIEMAYLQTFPSEIQNISWSHSTARFFLEKIVSLQYVEGHLAG